MWSVLGMDGVMCNVVGSFNIIYLMRQLYVLMGLALGRDNTGIEPYHRSPYLTFFANTI